MPTLHDDVEAKFPGKFRRRRQFVKQLNASIEAELDAGNTDEVSIATKVRPRGSVLITIGAQLLTKLIIFLIKRAIEKRLK